MKTQVQNFLKYHHLNPHVYEMFKGYIKEVKDAGKTKYSARTILHRMRWHANIETRRIDEFKIGDHHSPYYARMYMHQWPDDEGFFSVKNITGLADFDEWLYRTFEVTPT
tara:strand:+ start:37 stop:366 length:330 start_codon:yes stop_codon:yes gene_type:complete